MSKKIRLDVLVTERGLCESRQKAQATIMAGLVFVDGQRSDKPGTPVAEDASVEVRGHALRYVSRGGLKLEKAMQTFPITLEGKVCADIGASTGGFTDCMLQNGAAKVYAVDVGYGQLDWKLRSDARVVCLERTNARYLSTEQIPETLDFASIDVSFISLKLIFPALYALLREGGEVSAESARDEILHTVACKAAIKAGRRHDTAELERIACAVAAGEVKYCPHGRPVKAKLTKYELEKMFKRA